MCVVCCVFMWRSLLPGAVGVRPTEHELHGGVEEEDNQTGRQRVRSRVGWSPIVHTNCPPEEGLPPRGNQHVCWKGGCHHGGCHTGPEHVGCMCEGCVEREGGEGDGLYAPTQTDCHQFCYYLTLDHIGHIAIGELVRLAIVLVCSSPKLPAQRGARISHSSPRASHLHRSIWFPSCTFSFFAYVSSLILHL